MRPREHRAPRRRPCRALASAAAILGLATACGPREPALTSPGTSTANAVGSPRSSGAPDAAVQWERFDDLATFQSMGAPFVSRGHFAGKWKAEVRANPAASEVYGRLARSSQFQAGSVLVKKHMEKDSGAPGPIFAMVKHKPGYFRDGGDWEYVVTDAQGWVEDRGPLVACARCHAEATADWGFGLPASAVPR